MELQSRSNVEKDTEVLDDDVTPKDVSNFLDKADLSYLKSIRNAFVEVNLDPNSKELAEESQRLLGFPIDEYEPLFQPHNLDRISLRKSYTKKEHGFDQYDLINDLYVFQNGQFVIASVKRSALLVCDIDYRGDLSLKTLHGHYLSTAMYKDGTILAGSNDGMIRTLKKDSNGSYVPSWTLQCDRHDRTIDKIFTNEYGTIVTENSHSKIVVWKPNDDLEPIFTPFEIKGSEGSFKQDIQLVGNKLYGASNKHNLFEVDLTDSEPKIRDLNFPHPCEFRAISEGRIMVNYHSLIDRLEFLDIETSPNFSSILQTPIDVEINGLQSHLELLPDGSIIFYGSRKSSNLTRIHRAAKDESGKYQTKELCNVLGEIEKIQFLRNGELYVATGTEVQIYSGELPDES